MRLLPCDRTCVGRTLSRTLLCASALLSGACSGSDASRDTATAGEHASDSVGNARPSDSAAAESTTVPNAPTATALLALDGEGLRVVNSATGSTRAIGYGTPAADVLSAVTAMLGTPTDRGTNAECGAGAVDFVTFPGGLQLVLQRDRFVGWTARPNGDQPLRTMSNIGLGSTRAELEAVYAANIARSTIGMEFMAGGLQGVLESDAPTGRITDLWSGVACVMR